MAWPESVHKTLNRLKTLQRELNDDFVGREVLVRTLVLGAVCQEHVLLLGPPGTAKTDMVNRFAEAFDMPCFHYLLTRFTEPAELFGPMDLPAFEQGRVHVRTDGMLPKAAIAFLDEVFRGGSAILNTLLTLVHERRFHNGAAREEVPLISLIGAANDLPDDPTLQA